MSNDYVGRLIACIDPETGQIIAAGTVVEQQQDGEVLELTVHRYPKPDTRYTDRQRAETP